KSHYWTLRGEYLQHSAKQAEIQLASSYLGVRGTPFYTGNRQFAVGITYGAPLCYPDIGLGNILYTRRIRVQPFFDFGSTVLQNGSKIWQQSVGIETLFDFEIPPVTLGL